MAPPILFTGLYIFIAIFVSVIVISVTERNQILELSNLGQNLVQEYPDGAQHSYLMQRLCPCSNVNIPATDERIISNQVFNQLPTQDIPDKRGLSSFAWIIMQFLDHDITRTGSKTGAQSDTMDFNTEITMTLTPAIYVNDTDNCRIAKTFISNALDGTNIYSDYRFPERGDRLRLHKDGLMRMTPNGFLPRNPNSTNEVFAGDIRASEHAMLTTMHTLWVREHNRVAREIRDLVPVWSDNDIYWKARQIVVATYQHILYNEALPALFGNEAFNKYLGNSSFSSVHGDGLRISSEFSNAAFRYGHSMISNNIGKYPLKDLFFDADFVENEGLESLILEAQKTRSQAVDLHIVDGLRNILFGNFGEDLMTRNLYKARQLHIATYQTLAQCYGFPPVDIVADADPIRGLLSEPVMPGSSLPLGIAIIVGEQLGRTFRNDPNFYLNSAQSIGSLYFKKIKSSTLRDVVVRNTEIRLSQLPANMFFVSG